MSLEEFDYKNFALDLARQAGQVFPSDIDEENKRQILYFIRTFSIMAGESLANDENSILTPEEKSIIVQFISEWTFHKGIDLSRMGVSKKEIKEKVLQKVAYVVFEVVKKGVENALSQEQLITIAEKGVNKAFKKAIKELQEKNIIPQDIDASNFSNIDTMQVEKEAEPEKEVKIDITKPVIQWGCVIAILVLSLCIKYLPN